MRLRHFWVDKAKLVLAAILSFAAVILFINQFFGYYVPFLSRHPLPGVLGLIVLKLGVRPLVYGTTLLCGRGKGWMCRRATISQESRRPRVL